ncbi:MAG TPA: arginine--tRNA ligase, partial [Bacteroidales bacterium]
MIEQKLSQIFQQAVLELYAHELPAEAALVQKTRPDFEGDYTIVVFPILRISKKSPDLTAEEIGNFILKNMPEAEAINVMKGFLNISISINY